MGTGVGPWCWFTRDTIRYERYKGIARRMEDTSREVGMDMEDRVSTVITARNTGDKLIGTYALGIALLAVISFVNFFLLTFVPLSPSIKQILTVFDYGVA